MLIVAHDIKKLLYNTFAENTQLTLIWLEWTPIYLFILEINCKGKNINYLSRSLPKLSEVGGPLVISFSIWGNMVPGVHMEGFISIVIINMLVNKWLMFSASACTAQVTICISLFFSYHHASKNLSLFALWVKFL